jgi:hypothetical protein
MAPALRRALEGLLAQVETLQAALPKPRSERDRP